MKAKLLLFTLTLVVFLTWFILQQQRSVCSNRMVQQCVQKNFLLSYHAKS